MQVLSTIELNLGQGLNWALVGAGGVFLFNFFVATKTLWLGGGNNNKGGGKGGGEEKKKKKN